VLFRSHDMRNQSQESTTRGTPPYEEGQASSPAASQDGLDFALQKLPDLAAEFSQETADALLARATDLRQRVMAGFERQRDRTADTLERLSRAFDFVGTEVQRQDESTARQLERTGARMRDAAGYIGAASPASLTRDLTRLAHTTPAAVFGGSFVVGAMLGRFLKASQRASGPSRSSAISTAPTQETTHEAGNTDQFSTQSNGTKEGRI